MTGGTSAPGPHERLLEQRLLVAGAIGIVLSLVNALSRRSLWLDEAMLSLNIMTRTPAGLLQPLDDGQLAPPLYLLLTKAFAAPLDYSEFALRMVSLLSYWGSILLLVPILTLLRFSSRTAMLAMVMFCCNASVLNYANEVKQYATEVLTGLLLVYTALRRYRAPLYKVIALAVLGSVSIYLAYIAPIMLVAAGAYLLFEAAGRRIPWQLLALPFAAWLLCYAAFYLEFVRYHPTRREMADAWRNHFLPVNPAGGRFLRLLKMQLFLPATSIVEFDSIGKVFLPFYVFGAFRLWRTRNYAALIFCIVPLMVHLLLSLLRLYPSAKRLNLYQAPFYILLFVQGVDYSLEWVQHRWPRLRAWPLTLLFPLLLLKQVMQDFPRKKEEMKDAFRLMAPHIRAEDSLYISHAGVPAFTYYRLRGIAPAVSSVVQGAMPRAEKQRYHNQLNNLSSRTWVLFSHFHEREKDRAIQQLDNRGTRTLNLQVPGIEVHLYRFPPDVSSADGSGK